ncbi:hypothetical protein A9Q99_18170 [Gammaproteobacteria bacterium 45_16_T64]|nr:hypothetical protein A9Q99_18170 [Gammaproteobacteria bacterium 45_16_T64]
MIGSSPRLMLVTCILAGLSFLSVAHADSLSQSMSRKPVIDHWTTERIKGATPRDFVIDHRGLGYLKEKNGNLKPHGHQLEAIEPVTITPRGKPSSSNNDTVPPAISNMDPSQGSMIDAAYTFSAVISDDSGLKSVVFVIEFPSGATQSFTPARSGDTWSVGLQGFTNGEWRWWVVAKDFGAKGGNTAMSAMVEFSVGSGSSGDGGESSDTITNSAWSLGGVVQTAAGRIYFEMPTNKRRKRWSGYVCSGTVVDGVAGRSIILTAAHCVYDDVSKAFARNVMFIPNQAATTGAGTDLNCGNDPLGCWSVSYGVVDTDWTTRTFPENVAWDYAFYVVDDNDDEVYAGSGVSGDVLDLATNPMAMQFASPSVDDGEAGKVSLDFTHALGYSLSDDPSFMYCAEDMTTEGTENWWLPNCGLSGGASGGPWVQPMHDGTGDGPVVSVNSWGYTTEPGMAGPRLNGTTASCIFSYAVTNSDSVPTVDGEAGVVLSNCP